MEEISWSKHLIKEEKKDSNVNVKIQISDAYKHIFQDKFSLLEIFFQITGYTPMECIRCYSFFVLLLSRM